MIALTSRCAATTVDGILQTRISLRLKIAATPWRSFIAQHQVFPLRSWTSTPARANVFSPFGLRIRGGLGVEHQGIPIPALLTFLPEHCYLNAYQGRKGPPYVSKSFYAQSARRHSAATSGASTGTIAIRRAVRCVGGCSVSRPAGANSMADSYPAHTRFPEGQLDLTGTSPRIDDRACPAHS